MRYYRIRNTKGIIRLCVEIRDGSLVDLTSLNEEVFDFRHLLKASYITGSTVDTITAHILSHGQGDIYNLEDLIQLSKNSDGNLRIMRPLDPDEMWAAGPGNFEFSEDIVKNMPEEGRKVYESDRPAMTYKGTSQRLVGPYDNIGIRGDIESTKAEGEMVLVIYKGSLVAFSTGHEVSGGLMGESMWWAAASKVFKGSSSLGPCIVTPETISDPSNLRIECIINRNGKEFEKSTNVTKFKRSPEKIVERTVEHDTPPDLVILYSGGIVAGGPMLGGDVVRISLEDIGYVENTVEIV